MFYFDPTAAEVHDYVAGWFGDREIHDSVGQHLHLITSPSIRTYYVLAEERKRAGPRPNGEDWRSYILRQMALTGPALLVARLLADPRDMTMEDRVQEFIEQQGGCRSTFYLHAQRLRARRLFPTALARSRHSDSFMR